MPGPAVYDTLKGLDLVKGKISPNITIGKKFKQSNINNPELSPGPGAYDR